MADVISSVGAGQTYASYSLWEAASGGTGTDHYIGEGTGDCGSGGTVSGWVAGARGTMRPATGQGHNGMQADSGAYIDSAAGIFTYSNTEGIVFTIEDIGLIGANTDEYEKLVELTDSPTNGSTMDFTMTGCLVEIRVDNSASTDTGINVVELTATANSSNYTFENNTFYLNDQFFGSSGDLILLNASSTTGGRVVTVQQNAFVMSTISSGAASMKAFEMLDGGNASNLIHRNNYYHDDQGDVGVDVDQTADSITTSNNATSGFASTNTEIDADGSDNVMDTTDGSFNLTPVPGGALDATGASSTTSTDQVGVTVPQGSAPCIGPLELTVESTGASYYDVLWLKRKRIRINRQYSAGGLTSVPVNIDLADLGTDFWTASNGGGEIRITKKDGITEVAREIVAYTDNGTSGTGEVWFLADALEDNDSTADSFFYLYYSNAAASDYATNATFGAQNVWPSGYEGVWHLQEDPSGSAPQMVESTSNERNGTSDGTMTTGDSVPGRCGGNAIDFDGSDDSVSTSIFPDGTYSTISFWFNPDVFAGQSFRSSGCHDSSNHRFYLGIDTNNCFSGWGSGFTSGSPHNMSIGTWYYMTMVEDGSGNSAVHVNGVECDTLVSTFVGTSVRQMYIGGRSSTAGTLINSYMDGQIDEFRVSTDSISVAQIFAEYFNQNGINTFYFFDAEEDAPAAGGFTPYYYNTLLNGAN